MHTFVFVKNTQGGLFHSGAFLVIVYYVLNLNLKNSTYFKIYNCEGKEKYKIELWFALLVKFHVISFLL